ncbi:MAG TPA: MFS transporter [Rhodospirillales bacterium]|nr:MFS transporter [Rhodospirillales bacterium]
MAARRDLALVIGTASIVGMTISLSLPLLSLVLERHGFGAGAIGLNAMASGLGIFLVAPVMGGLLRRLGPRPAAAAGMVVAALATLALPLEVALLPWFLLRLVMSAGTAIVFVVSEAAINALVEDERRGRTLGVYATVFSIGYAVGPLLVAATGSAGYLPFLVTAFLFAAGLPPLLAARGLDRALGGDGPRPGIAAFLGILKRAPLPLFAIFCFGVVETSHFALFPLYGLAAGYREETVGLMLAVWITGNILLQYPVGWLADRLPRLLVLALLAALAAASLFALPALIGDRRLIWPLLLVMGGATGAVYTLSLVLVGQRFSGFELALANTAFVMMIEAGMLAGPAAIGLAMNGFGPEGLPVVAGLVLAFLAAAAAAAGMRSPRAA